MLRRALALLLAAVLGCGDGAAPIDAAPPDTGRGTGCRPGDCPEGEICLAGVCVDPLEDRDRDGLSVTVDCDDGDAAVGLTAEPRPCTNSCRRGTETCVMGVWQECDCEDDCPAGAVRDAPCGRCGSRRQLCEDGVWVDEGECEGEPPEACEPGEVDSAGPPCGRCGHFERSCLSSCGWESWTTCVDVAECAPGDTDDEFMPCGDGMCGSERVRSRTCDDECRWPEFPPFPDECLAGGCVELDEEREEQACGRCGSGHQARTRVCPPSCAWGAWGAWGACDGETGCEPGEPSTDAQPCGDCDTGHQERSRACTSACAWGAWGAWSACADVTGCTPGIPDVAREGCGACGSGTRARTRECDASCGWGAWGSWSACSGAVGCVPLDTEVDAISCGACGDYQERTRTCDAACAWGSWGAYGPCIGGGGGVCEPFALDTQARTCGNCGTQGRTRACEESCTWASWSAWGTCGGGGACAPGTTDAPDVQPCGPCGNGTRSRLRTCDSGCAWGSWGAWGACAGARTCAPDEVEEESAGCGLCGFGERVRTRTCDAACQWGSWGSYGECEGDVQCIDPCGFFCPGATARVVSGCAAGTSTHICTCSPSGSWTSCGPCSGPPLCT